MANKPKYTIAVTALNAIDSPGPGVSVIRALKDAESFEVRIIGLAYETLEPGIYMHDLVDKTYLIPYPSAGADALSARLYEIHQLEKLDMVIPNFDAELFSFIRLSNQLKIWGIHTFLPTEEQFNERHKHNLVEFGEKHSIIVPRSKAIFEKSGIAPLADEYSYPLVVKGKFYEAGIAYNSEQAYSYFDKISAKWGLPIIIQEYIQGTEFNVTGLGDGKGNTIAAIPMRKQYITDKGKAWGGITVADNKMLELTRHFISSTHWRGGFELELMKDKNGVFYLLEINPRMPAWIYLSVGAGQNIPEALVKLAMGMNPEPFKTYESAKMFIRYAWDMIVDIKDFEQISMHGEL